MTLSRDFLLFRGECCHRRCKNCPYSLEAVKEALSEVVYEKYMHILLEEWLDLIEAGEYNKVYSMIKDLKDGISQ